MRQMLEMYTISRNNRPQEWLSIAHTKYTRRNDNISKQIHQQSAPECKMERGYISFQKFYLFLTAFKNKYAVLCSNREIITDKESNRNFRTKQPPRKVYVCIDRLSHLELTKNVHIQIKNHTGNIHLLLIWQMFMAILHHNEYTSFSHRTSSTRFMCSN